MNAARLLLLGSLVVGAGASSAQERGIESDPDEERQAQIERLRAEIANEIQLKAYDLVDEMAFTWLETPPFSQSTAVVLADVIAPLGYGSGLEALIENHLAQVLVSNPDTNVRLAHCPSCNAIVVHSDQQGTVIGRGVDQPGALKKIRGDAGAEYALFLDFEAEGTALVMRARITQLDDDLSIVYAKTLSTATSAAPMLRSPTQIKSAEKARAEYLELLQERGPIRIPVRLTLSAFAPGDDATLAVPIPIPWVQVGGEMAIGSARAWTGQLAIGATMIPTVYTGARVSGRIYRLLSGTTFSLTRPNVYVYLGGALAALQGPAAAILTPTTDPPIIDFLGTVATYPSLESGIELRVSNRIVVGAYIESMPTLQQADNVGNWLTQLGTGIEWGIVQVNSFGVEAAFSF